MERSIHINNKGYINIKSAVSKYVVQRAIKFHLLNEYVKSKGINIYGEISIINLSNIIVGRRIYFILLTVLKFGFLFLHLLHL
jgi:hypothetical protein